MDLPSSSRASFGELLKQHRLAAGLTQAQLAERAGLSPRGISDLERGAHRLPQRETLDLLVRALCLTSGDRARLEAARDSPHPASNDLPQPAPRGRPRRADPASPRTLPGRNLPGQALPGLVGRAAEVALLEQHLDRAGPPLLLLAGEPGIGKTRLLQEAALHAHRHGWTVLEGGCSRSGGQEPYAPLLQALQRHLDTCAPAQRRACLLGCAWLVRLLPELAGGEMEPLPAWTLSPEQERRLVFRAAGRYLTNVAGAAGTLLLLDDLQWAGADALELLIALVRSDSTLPLRVVGAYRDTDVRPNGPLWAGLADLAQAEVARRHSLQPLCPAAAAQLLEVLLDGVRLDELALREQVLQRAGGVPFFLRSCSQALRDTPPDGVQLAVPWDVAHSVQQRVAMLPEAARLVLGVAAVVGREVPRPVLLAGADLPEQQAVDGLEAACRARLLEEQGVHAYRFPHDLIREVLEAELGAARRALLHRRIAEVLERQGARQPALLAYHYLRAGKQERAIIYLEQAGDQARAQGALAEAEAAYRELVACLDGLGRTREIASAREKLGEMLNLQCRYDETLEVLDGAAAAFRAAKDREGLLRVTAAMGWTYDARGTTEEGLRLLLARLAQQDPGEPSPGLALLVAAVAALHTFISGYGECLAAAEHAVAMARTLGDDKVLVHTGRVYTWALFFCGQHQEALQQAQVTCQLAEAIGAVGDLSDLLHAAAVICEMCGEFDRGKQLAQDSVRNAEQLGMLVTVRVNLTRLGAICFFSGSWEQARAHYTRALAIAVQAADYHTTLLHTGQLYLAEGSWDLAQTYLQQSSDLARQTKQLIILKVAESHLAELDILDGRPESAHARLLPLLEQTELEESEVTTYVLPRLAWAAFELGRLDQAESLLGQALSRQRAHGYLLALLDTLRVQGLLFLRTEQWALALHALNEGLALARQIGCPYGEARLLHVYGQLHAQKGAPDPARARMEQALAIFRRLGARKDLEQVEHDLAALQRRAMA